MATNAYLAKRNANVAQLAQDLRESGFNKEKIDQTKAAILKASSSAAPKPSSNKRAAPTPTPDSYKAEPRRRSQRGQDIETIKTETKEEKEERERLAEEERIKQYRQAQKVKHGNRLIAASEQRDDALCSIEEQLARYAADLKSTTTKAKSPSKSPSKAKAPKSTDAAIGAFTEKLESLQLMDLQKVVPERIYSMAVLPSLTFDAVFVGDKIGNIALWDCTELAKAGLPMGGTGGDGDEEGSSEPLKVEKWKWLAHPNHSVSCLKFNPISPASLFSGSYDCTIRSTNFETGHSSEIIDGDAFTGEGLIHAFDFTPDGNEIWASDHNGGLLHRDLRAPIGDTRRWTIDRAKVGGFSINPTAPHLAVTAHLKTEMRLWDLRKLVGLAQDALDSEIQSCVLAKYKHEKACTSAYFDSTGTKVVSTSYDDHVRVWNFNSDPAFISKIPESWEPTSKYGMNMQSGRYVTLLRAPFSIAPVTPTNPIHFTIASMQRSLDVFAVPENGKVQRVAQLYDPEFITAVPAVTASHPLKEGRYWGGNGSGKVSFFA